MKILARTSFSIIATSAGLWGGTFCSAYAQTEAASAESILKRMATTYEEAHSYSDKSVANYRNPDGSERLHVEFRIWFARPAHFRIDAQSKSPEGATPRREVMWADGTAARSWASDKAVTSRPKVKIAGSGMFGTYAYHLPTLLEASYGGPKRLHEMNSATVAGEENFEGTDCYRITGDWQGGIYELWIGKNDHLLRKLVAKYKDHDMEEIHREVALNTAIPLEVFRFAPEKEAAPPSKK